MKTKLEELTGPVADDIYDTVAFKNIVEDNLSWIINDPTNTSKPVTAHMVEVYAFDWLGLLNHLQIPPMLHHTVIRMNGGMSFTDLPNELRALRIPSIGILQGFVMMISSTGKVR